MIEGARLAWRIDMYAPWVRAIRFLSATAERAAAVTAAVADGIEQAIAPDAPAADLAPADMGPMGVAPTAAAPPPPPPARAQPARGDVAPARVAPAEVVRVDALPLRPEPAPVRSLVPLRPGEGDAMLESVIAHAVDAVVIVDPIGTITYASPAFGRVLALNEKHLLGRNVLDLVHPDDATATRAALTSVGSRDESAMNLELRAQHDDGSWRWLEATATNLLADPAVRGVAIQLRDVSERRRYEDDLRHRALHDTLTGLPNRTLLVDRLQVAIGRSVRESRSIAVFFLDLDSFKEVNDTLGHPAGDDVLVGVGRRLTATARGEDTVARFGGDEFVMVLEHDQPDDWVTEFAERLRSIFREPIRAGRRLVPVTASIGIATTSGLPSSPEVLLRNADAAMYRAKQSGRDAYVVFDDSMISDSNLAFVFD
jgi:diguanylate cyclase (GGDEF)-like protein/PAS domain S-box-containing protein